VLNTVLNEVLVKIPEKYYSRIFRLKIFNRFLQSIAYKMATADNRRSYQWWWERKTLL